jgi:DNA-binding transcriptional ArsR family regulator
MNATDRVDPDVTGIAAAIAAPARARMLYCLVDGCARTSTELALLADVTPSTASVHLRRLAEQRLVRVHARGRHRYYSLEGATVAAALEALGVLAGGPRAAAAPEAPNPLRAARSCYDHIAGALGVSLYARLEALGWLAVGAKGRDGECDLTAGGARAFEALGIDVEAARTLRRRFAYACVDWTERRPHLGGALGAAVLDIALSKRWVMRERDSRALVVSGVGRREFLARFGLRV